MAKMERDAEREERITMEIVVDAYGAEEQAMVWHCYLQDTMQLQLLTLHSRLHQ